MVETSHSPFNTARSCDYRDGASLRRGTCVGGRAWSANLDARASRKAQLQHGELSYYFDLINLLHRDDPCCVDEYDFALDRNREPTLIPRIGGRLPFLPSFGFQSEF